MNYFLLYLKLLVPDHFTCTVLAAPTRTYMAYHELVLVSAELIIRGFVVLSSFFPWPLDNLYFNKIMMESWKYASEIF